MAKGETKRIRYDVHYGSCSHWATEASRGEWRAEVNIFAVNERTGQTDKAAGHGKGSSARVAFREAINEAFGNLSRGFRTGS